MPIWHYKDLATSCTHLLDVSSCPFCNTELKLFSGIEDHIDGINGVEDRRRARVCDACGWWSVERTKHYSDINHVYTEHHGYRYAAAACLRQLNLNDITVPIEEIRQYLTACYGARSSIHPRLLEETVASVFRSLGYYAEVTAYSADGGIDVILDDGRSEIGVQVKRYKEAIQVEQIRSFAGALLLRGLTKGVFVTTSRFAAGVSGAVGGFAIRGYEIELLDAARFYDQLKVAQRPMYKTYDDFIAESFLDWDDLPIVWSIKGH